MKWQPCKTWDTSNVFLLPLIVLLSFSAFSLPFMGMFPNKVLHIYPFLASITWETQTKMVFSKTCLQPESTTRKEQFSRFFSVPIGSPFQLVRAQDKATDFIPFIFNLFCSINLWLIDRTVWSIGLIARTALVCTCYPGTIVPPFHSQNVIQWNDDVWDSLQK